MVKKKKISKELLEKLCRATVREEIGSEGPQ